MYPSEATYIVQSMLGKIPFPWTMSQAMNTILWFILYHKLAVQTTAQHLQPQAMKAILWLWCVIIAQTSCADHSR